MIEKVSAKEAFEKFKPESCVFVISVDELGKPNGMVAGYNMKCSMEPPLFAVGLSKKGNTRKLIEKSKEFVIAVPNKKLEDELLMFGTLNGSEINKFEESGIQTEMAEFVKSPLIKEATINFECELFKEIECGDHILFIGKILASHINQNEKVLLNMKRVDGKRIFKEF
ncbi:flavin reductase family protein [Candidatus Woesearchaeota archaeon]|nr:flavin reductase family protein [Candidatus Woesearchaeota archaeon]